MKRNAIFIAAALPMVTLFIFFVQIVQATNPWTNGQDASFVIGQPNFLTANSGLNDTALNRPKDVAIDLEHGKIYVLDADNNRILRYSYPVAAPQPSAELVFGQPDFSTSFSGTSQQALFNPRGIALDNTGRLWIGEFSNNRVIWFDDAYALDTNQPAADGVLGQPDFDSNQAATTNNGMAGVYDLVIDPTGTLFVADSGNNRILRFDDAANKDNGADADGVLGQAEFTSADEATTASGMHGPRGVAIYKDTLFVADRQNARVLRFDDATDKVNGADADGVLGQSDFTSKALATSQSGMSHVARVLVDAAGRLYVSDIFSNQRVLIFNDAKSLPNGAPADHVLGQATFVNSGAAIAQNRLNADSSGAGMAIDHENNRFYIADDLSNRVLGFQAGEPLTFPILTVTKEGPTSALVNDLITYTLTISNDGSAPATSMVITDVLPSGVEYVSGGALGADDLVSWNLATLEADAQHQVQFTVRATDVGEVINDSYGLAYAEGDTIMGVDDVITQIEGYPILEIEKSGPATVEVGDYIDYTLIVSNEGSEQATALVITDTVPAGTEYVSGGIAGNDGVVSWNLSNLAPGHQHQATLTVRAIEATTVSNDDYAVSYSEGDTVLGTNPVITTVNGEGALSIHKSGPNNVEANELITYTLTVTNTGTLPATSLVITDTLPSAAEYVSGGTLGDDNVVSWSMPHLSPGATFSVYLTVRATETITNDTYGVSFAEGDTVLGTVSVTTEIQLWKWFFPLIFR